MKRWIVLLLISLALGGCHSEQTLETVADEWLVPAMAQPRQISVDLPEDLAAPTLQQNDRSLYLAEDYEILLENLPSGDLNATIRSLTGFDSDQLTVMKTNREDVDRYDFVWTTAGEQGDRLGRGTILDDGNYHYCMTALRDDSETLIVWQEVFDSFCLN